jgi:hypothetical protein
MRRITTMKATLYRTLAYLTIGLHALTGIVALGGAPLSLISPWFALIHVPLAIWVVAAHWNGWDCPLTLLEKYFWRAAGTSSYEGTFVARYLFPAMDTTHVGRRQSRSIGVAAAIINIVLYAAVIISYAKAPRVWQPPTTIPSSNSR